jgi:uncharacterized protein YndB with AHSA1/START domain
MAQAIVKAGPSLTITRRYGAPREAVFRAFTDPQVLKQWFAPSDDFSVPVAAAELRAGGRYRIVMRSPDGEEHRVGGVYREIEAPRRLVFTWAWESTPERESLVTIELKEAGGGTELVLTHERFADAETRDKHQQGWEGCLARLTKVLA